MIVFQLLEAQTVKLLKLGIDTVAVIPLKTLRIINIQLKDLEELKANNVVLNKKLSRTNYLLLRKNASILEYQGQIIIKDSIINKQNLKITQQGWDWLRATNRYEREKKKADKFKRFFIGSLILSIGTITLISLK